MKHASKYLLILVLVATAASSLPASSHASPIRVAHPTELQTAPVSGPTQEAGGGLYSMACGLGMRFWPALGWNFAYNVTMVGFCMLALLHAAE